MNEDLIHLDFGLNFITLYDLKMHFEMFEVIHIQSICINLNMNCFVNGPYE